MREDKFSEAIPVLQQALNQRLLLGKENRFYNYTKFDLAKCYARTGKLDEAQKLLKECQPYVVLFEASCLEELAEVADGKKQYEDAESYYKEAIKLQEKDGYHSVDIVRDRRKLAEVAEKFGDYELAETQWTWLNDNESKNYDGIARAFGTFDLAEYYSRRGDFEKAEPFYKETCKIMDTEHKGTKEYIGWYYTKMGDFYLANKKLPQAKAAYLKALEMYKKGRKLPMVAPEPTPGIRESHPPVHVLLSDQVETEKKLSKL